MEFKQPRRKKTVFHTSDKAVIRPKKTNFFDDEDNDDLLDLYNLVSQDQKKTNKKSKKAKVSDSGSTKETIKKVVQKRKKLIFASFIIVFGIIALTFILKDEPKDVAGTSKKVADKHTFLEPGDTPPYKILYPGGKNAQNIGKIIKNNSPSQNSTYSYVDVVAGVEINVTQQEINELIKNNPEKTLEAAAKANNQNEIISVDGVTVYLGTSAKGPQVASFIKGNLIIFINTSDTISDDTWAAYISALHS